MTMSEQVPGTNRATQAVDDRNTTSTETTGGHWMQVTDVAAYYGDRMAISGVSMTIKPRAATAIIGPSGCGKSTFIR